MNRYKDKYFSIMGDSISTYEGYNPEGHAVFYSYRGAPVTNIFGWKDTWWGQVIEHFGGRLLVNNSWSGSYVCKPKACEIESYGCSDKRTSSLGADGISPDHIFVFIGTNDRGAGFPMYSEDKNDLGVIENAYRAMLDKIRANYPEAEIWCFTFPITSCSKDPYFLFPDTNFGIPMENYGELVKTVAREKKCHLIDLWDRDQLCDTIDHLHPNYSGMCTVAKKVIAVIENKI